MLGSNVEGGNGVVMEGIWKERCEEREPTEKANRMSRNLQLIDGRRDIQKVINLE